MNDFGVMYQERLESILEQQHVTNIMYHKIVLQLTSIKKLVVYKVNSMIRVNYLLSPTLVSYITTLL